MNKARQDLFFHVIDGDWNKSPGTEILPYLYLINKLRSCDYVLRWMISHGYTGNKFLRFMKSYETPGHCFRAILEDIQSKTRAYKGKMAKDMIMDA